DLDAGGYGDAVGLLRAAVADEPDNITAVYTLGLALTRSGQPAEGRALLDKSQTLRSAGYGVAFGAGYLEQGRYAEAIASSGAEPALIERRAPDATFAMETIATLPGGGSHPSPIGRAFSADGL